MSTQTFRPTHLNFKQLRKQRQEDNDKAVFKAICNDDKEALHRSVNQEALTRLLEDLNMTEDELLNYWREDREPGGRAYLASRNLSKNASRQGVKDEADQIQVCANIGKELGILISNLSPSAQRMSKEGKILTSKDMKEKNIKKDQCHKSFDGNIEGRLKGKIAAKVVYNNGGHQDNVFHEMDDLANSWKNYRKEPEDKLVILIDTDLQEQFERLREKYADVENVMVFNHVSLQQYMIDNYSG